MCDIGEGKRSGPNSSASQPIAVIPHPSCRTTTTAPPISRGGGVAGSSQHQTSSSPAIPSLPPEESLFHRHGSGEGDSNRRRTGPLMTEAVASSDPPPNPSIIPSPPMRDQIQLRYFHIDASSPSHGQSLALYTSNVCMRSLQH